MSDFSENFENVLTMRHKVKFGYDPIIRDIPDFPNYQISQFGEVYNKKTGNEMKLRNNSIRCVKNGKETLLKVEKIINYLFYDIPLNIDLNDFVEINAYPDYMINKNADIYSKKRKRLLKHQISKSGYFFVEMDDKPEMIHRLIAKQYIPNPEKKEFVDHINLDKSDNRVENLRWATFSENMTNRPMFSNNTSGFIGITKLNNYWYASIQKNKINESKSFPCTDEGLREACEWRNKMKKKLHGEFAYEWLV